MIDKIEATVKNGHFDVREDANLLVHPAAYDWRTKEKIEFELFHSGGKPIRGAYAENKSLENCDVRMDSHAMKVSFNPNIQIFGTNYFNCNEDQCRSSIEMIEKQLDSIGIECDFKDANLYRCDVVKQVPIEQPFLFYSSLFRSMSGKRLHRKEIGTTYNFGNKSRQIEFYDKLAELTEKKHFKEKDFQKYGIDENRNVLRCEFRALKGNIVQRDLELSKIGDFWNSGVYDHLTNKYRSHLNDLVFKKPNENQLQLAFIDELDSITLFKQHFSGGDAIDRYILAKFGGFDELLKVYGNLEVFQDVLKLAGFSRSTIWRKFRAIEKALAIASETRGGKSIIPKMYAEIYDKLMAA